MPSQPPPPQTHPHARLRGVRDLPAYPSAPARPHAHPRPRMRRPSGVWSGCSLASASAGVCVWSAPRMLTDFGRAGSQRAS